MIDSIIHDFEESLRKFDGYYHGKIDEQDAYEYLAMRHFKDLVARHDMFRDNLVVLAVMAVTETGEFCITEALDDAVFTIVQYYSQEIKNIISKLEREWLEANSFFKKQFNPRNTILGRGIIMKDYTAKKLNRKMADTEKRKSIFEVINNMSQAQFFVATVTLIGWGYLLMTAAWW